MKKETQLYKDLIAELVKQCVEHGHHGHFVRIESNYTNQGIPDINGCIDGHEFWIECKWDSELLSLQISWREQRQKSGGKVFCVKWDKSWYRLFYNKTVFVYGNIEECVNNIIGEVLK